MENENNLILQNQKYSSMIRPYVGASIINPFILDVVEKLGKYALIYDYKVINPYFGERDNFLRSIPLLPLSSPLKKTLVPENAPPFYYNFVPQISDTQALEMAKREQAIALAMQNVAITPREAIMPSVSYTVNPNPQVGTFSKGNIVNVLRFDGYYAIIQNPNYVEPDTTAPKVSFFTSLVGDMRNQKEFKIPKEYLSKVDDNTPVTISTGINFGANPKPQPIFNIPLPKLPNYQIIPELDNEVVLEQNANFVLSKDFQYDRTYTQGKPLYELGGAGRLQFEQKANYKTLPIGTKVTGRLIRRRSNSAYKVVYGVTQPPSYNDFLDVKGYGEKGRIEIPIEYLTREVENIISTDTRTPASVIALVDKKTGKCNETGTIRTMNYNPCRVSAIKGQIYNGYIVGNNFFDGKDAYLTVNEYQIIPQNNGTIVPVKNNNKNLLMIAGAFLAGYIIFGNSKSSN
jgi:hypothetical protein